MSPKLFKELKVVNFSCTSPASAAVNASTVHQQQQSMLMSSIIGGRAIDRCSPHLRDPLRAKTLNPLLSHSQPQSPNRPKNFISSSKNKKISEKKPSEFISPASSQRYLLSGSSNSEEYSLHSERSASSTTIVSEASRFKSANIEESTVVKEVEPLSVRAVMVEKSNEIGPSSSSTDAAAAATTTRAQEKQVVVLRVSLHCKGCEGKVRKHISKMEGVTSFTTDLINKKVTVVGDVTPLGVLNSISKVKNTQLWPSHAQASS